MKGYAMLIDTKVTLIQVT